MQSTYCSVFAFHKKDNVKNTMTVRGCAGATNERGTGTVGCNISLPLITTVVN